MPNRPIVARARRWRWLGFAACLATWPAAIAPAQPAPAPTTQSLDAALPFVVPFEQTLEGDFVIRITDKGFDFLAQQIQWLFYGWVPLDAGDNIQAGVVEASLNAFLHDSLNGFVYGDSLVTESYCIILKNTSDDTGDGNRCLCPAGTLGVKGDTTTSKWENCADTDCCANCGMDAADNPTPTAAWASAPGRSSTCPGGSTINNYQAFLRDPGNPESMASSYFCKGPFYDSVMFYDNYRIDPDCLVRSVDGAWTGACYDNGIDPCYCPSVGTGQSCNGVCDATQRANNDIAVTMTADPGNQEIDITIVLDDVNIDGWLYVQGVSSFGEACCWWGDDSGGGGDGQQNDGRMLDQIGATIDVSMFFIDGYWNMLGRDGDSAATPPGPPDNGACSPEPEGPPALEPARMDDDTLLMISLVANAADLDNGGLELSDDWSGCEPWGWFSALTCGLADGLIDALDFLFEGLLEDIVGGILAAELEGLISDTFGMPLDMAMLVAGEQSQSPAICALRLPAGNRHGATCTHGVADLDGDGDNDSGSCPCDDADRDGWLNYQDPDAGSTPSGCPAGTWCGTWDLADDEGNPEEGDGELYLSWYYGLGNGIGGYEDADPPFFEIGAYMDDYWDGGGGIFNANILVSTTIVPYRWRADDGYEDGFVDDSPAEHPGIFNDRTIRNPNQGYFPDPDGLNGRGVWYDDPTDGWPARSCYAAGDLSGLRVDALANPPLAANDLGDPRNDGPNPVGWEALLNDFDNDVGLPGPDNHYMFLISQQFLQEFFYGMYASGLLCVNVTRQNFDFLEDSLRVANFRSVVPILGDVDGDTYVWHQDGYVELRFVPSAVPVVRVLGARDGCFPAGDVIGPFDAQNVHDDGPGGALELHDAANSCSGSDDDVDTVNRDNVYDLFAYFPAMWIEIYAPPAEPADFGGAELVKLMTLEWDLGLAMAIEYSTACRDTPFTGQCGLGGGTDKFFEILIDGFLGCGGLLFGGGADPGYDFDTNPIPGYGSPTCGVIDTDLPGGLGDVEQGLSGVLHTLINATFSTVLKTKLFLGGLSIDFFKIGFANEQSGGLTPGVLDSEDTDSDGSCADEVYDYGCGTEDFLVLAGQFDGTVDFASLFSVLGGLGAPEVPLGVNTFVGLAGAPAGGAVPAVAAGAERIELSPRESARAGLGRGGALVLDGLVYGLDAPDESALMRYSLRLNGGTWRPYRRGSTVTLPWLPAGRHVVEVRAKGPMHLVDESPAEVVFWVDDVAPDLFVDDDRERSALHDPGVVVTRELFVRARDNVSAPGMLDLSVRIDDGDWAPLLDGYVDISLLAAEQSHAVELRAVDEFANERTVRLYAMPPAPLSGCGCAVASGGAAGWPASAPLLFALMGWLVLRRRRAG